MAAIEPGDVCVTGMAWDTPLGDTLDGAWQRLLAGESGLRPAPTAYPVRNLLAGTVTGSDRTVPGPSGSTVGPDGDCSATRRQLALTTGTLRAAFAAAGLDPAAPAARLVLGTSYGPFLDEPAETLDQWATAAAAELRHPHSPVCVTTACSAGADAIAVAGQLIEAGVTEICVAGGVDVLTNAKRLGHSALGTMSPVGLRAFDQEHDGMVLGEGAAFLVLESARHARRRGARIHAVLRASGSANDAAGLTTPDSSGDSVVLAVRRCLTAAGPTGGQVAVISAHGTGTPVNDEVESRSLGRIFAGQRQPLVFATKGALGHSLGATGAIEAVSLLLALRDGLAPPILGLRAPLPDFPLPLASAGPTPFSGTCGISVTIGFGGFNTCLLFERADDEPA